MGGDYAPLEIIKGAELAIEKFDNIEIILLGNKEMINKNNKDEEKLKYIYTTEIISNNESPVTAIRKKKNYFNGCWFRLTKFR